MWLIFFFKVADDVNFLIFFYYVEFIEKGFQNYLFLTHLFGIADDKYSYNKRRSSVSKSRKATSLRLCSLFSYSKHVGTSHLPCSDMYLSSGSIGLLRVR